MNINKRATLNVLYFTLGNSLVMHLQIKFSLLTIASQMSPEGTIIVMTDTPDLYKIDNLPCKLKVIKLDDEMKENWQSFYHNGRKFKFFWRVKIKAIQTVGKMYPHCHLMYLDGDTCLAGKFSEINACLDNNIPLMHCDEGSLSEMRGLSLRMWNQINNKTYDGITICDKFHEWNAGVVAIPAGKVEKLSTQALTICDKMISEDVEPLVVEQYSLSTTLFNYNPNMKEAKQWIIHYWHNKYLWSKYISNFFCTSYYLKRDVEDEIKTIRKININSINRWLKINRIIRKYTFSKR